MSTAELVVAGTSARTAVREALAGWFETVEGLPETTERVYYDTFDGLLHAAGMTLCLEHGELVLTRRDGGGARPGEPLPDEPTTPLRVESLAPGALRAALAPIVGVRVLLETARVRLVCECDAVLDERQKTVVRLMLERPERLGDRVRVMPLRGYDREGGQVTELLLDSQHLRRAAVPLVDAAVAAGGGNPAGVGPGLDTELDPGEPADVAAARVLLRLTEVRRANLPGVLEDVDIEFLHDYRVALRRTRAVVRELKGVFPAEEIGWLRAELRWLQTATGETRDLDVYLDEFVDLRELSPESMRGDLEPLQDVLRERHLQARMEMVRALRGERAEHLEQRFDELLRTLPELPRKGRPDARRPVDELASASILKLHRRMITMGRAIDRSSPAEAYHELRKQGKELRYMLEIFGRRLHDPEVVRSLIRALKALQDVLGRHQDREVQLAMLRELAEPVAAQPRGAAAVMAMGAMIDTLECEAAAARADFHDRFVLFSSREQRRLVKETFG